MNSRTKSSSRSNLVSAVIGGILLALGFALLAWILFNQHSSPPHVSLPGLVPTVAYDMQIAPLLAEGVTLAHTGQTASLSEQQALFLASELEPDAAIQAQHVTAKYVALNYLPGDSLSMHFTYSNVPVWMVWYQHIPFQPADVAVDPTPFPRTYHDLYVFLDANSGKELLSIWV